MRVGARAWWGCVALGPVAYGCARTAPAAWVEAHFVGFAQALAAAIGAVTGLFPWSVAEMGSIVLAFTVLGLFGRAVRRNGLGPALSRSILLGIPVLSIGYTVFVAMWGLDYGRPPLRGAFGFDDARPTVREVRLLTAALVGEVNAARLLVQEDGEGVARLSESLDDTLSHASVIYGEASGQWGFLGGRYSRAKPVWMSPILSYLGVAGVYIPFTAEPHLNTSVPVSSIPFNVCHEMAHQRGVAREDEANFVAWLVARGSNEPDFRYSAALIGATYAVNALQKVDRDAAAGIWSNLGLGARRDLAARAAWQEQYASPLGDLGAGMNQAYLRSNGVADGVASYGRVVELMVAYRRKEGRPEAP